MRARAVLQPLNVFSAGCEHDAITALPPRGSSPVEEYINGMAARGMPGPADVDFTETTANGASLNSSMNSLWGGRSTKMAAEQSSDLHVDADEAKRDLTILNDLPQNVTSVASPVKQQVIVPDISGRHRDALPVKTNTRPLPEIKFKRPGVETHQVDQAANVAMPSLEPDTPKSPTSRGRPFSSRHFVGSEAQKDGRCSKLVEQRPGSIATQIENSGKDWCNNWKE